MNRATLLFTLLVSLGLDSSLCLPADRFSPALAAPPSASETTQATSTPIDDRFIQKLVRVDHNKTVFTLFAFLNAAGYDDENNPRSMHPVRVKVRQEVASRLGPALQDSMKKFYGPLRSKMVPWDFLIYAAHTTGPPDFQPTEKLQQLAQTLVQPEKLEALKPLSALLQAFYREAQIEALFEKVRPEYENAIAQNQQAIRDEFKKLFTFLKVQSTEGIPSGKQVLYIPNLLESYFKALAYEIDGTIYDVEGPQDPWRYTPHEFVHTWTVPLKRTLAFQRFRLRCARIFLAVSELENIRGYYLTVEDFIDECLVRALVLNYREQTGGASAKTVSEELEKEFKLGFILTKHFYRQLDAYTASGKTFREFAPRLFENFEPQKELEAWQATMKK